MPNRIIKESICTSESIEQLSWFEEVFFYRLTVNCDDYGRLDARAAILKSRLFPLKEGVTLKQIEAALSKLSTVGMVQVYKYDQKPFLQLINWGKHQSVRNKRSKYPEPPAFEINCLQLQADVPVIQSGSLSESKDSLSEQNSDGEKRSERTPKVFPDDSDEMKLSLLLFRRMRRNNPDCKEPNLQAWCKHIDRMLRLDGRAPRDVQDIIIFSQDDPFWQANILSTETLRKKYDQLVLKKREKETPQPRGNADGGGHEWGYLP